MGESLEVRIGRTLRQRGLTLATAESCTGGLVGHLITNVAGSSDYFLGGIVAYANQVKANLLGVEGDTLNQHGAVSRQSALQMAQGACRTLGAQIGVSVTGIAGPGGGSPQKPVGLTWVAVCTAAGAHADRYLFEGDREHNKKQAAQAALALLLRTLEAEG